MTSIARKLAFVALLGSLCALTIWSPTATASARPASASIAGTTVSVNPVACGTPHSVLALDADPADEHDCWSSCTDCTLKNDCEHKHGNDRDSCEQACYDKSTTCCEKLGKKGAYKGCGCK